MAGRDLVLSPRDDTVWFAFEKTLSGINKKGASDKVSQEAGRAFKSINERCRGWCPGRAMRLGRKEGT